MEPNYDPVTLTVLRDLWDLAHERGEEVARLKDKLATTDDFFQNIDPHNQFVKELSNLSSHEVVSLSWWLEKKGMTLLSLTKKATQLYDETVRDLR